MTDVTHAPDRSRFEAGSAYLAYARTGNRFDIQHTVVPKDMEGEGVGGELVRTAVKYARDEGLELVVTCPFARRYLAKHPDVLGGE
jgi:predicted GNAT family acetyltransferase